MHKHMHRHAHQVKYALPNTHTCTTHTYLCTQVSGSYDTTVRFWDAISFRCLRKCDGHADAVRVLAAGSGHVFSGAYDGSVGVWASTV